jgi:hypothetical protein
MRTFIVSIFCALLLPAVAFADDRFDRGSWRVAVGLDSGSGTLAPDIAYFLANDLEFVVHLDSQALRIKNSGSPDSEANASGFGASLAYDFQTASIVTPFLGGGFIYYHDDASAAGTKLTDADQTGIALFGGVRFLVGPKGSIDLTLTGEGGTLKDNIASTSNDFSYGEFGVAYSVYF